MHRLIYYRYGNISNDLKMLIRPLELDVFHEFQNVTTNLKPVVVVLCNAIGSIAPPPNTTATVKLHT